MHTPAELRHADLARRSDLEVPTPYLLYLGDIASRSDSKTALGLTEWRPEWCVGYRRLPGCGVMLPLPEFDFDAARAAGARTVVVGVAVDGGRLPEHWLPDLARALDAGLHIACGLHDRLHNYPELVERARRAGVALHDVRHLPAGLRLPVANGARRSGRRVLTVGTDCEIGKKFTALSLEREMRRCGVAADFRATGQTGVLISGGGLAIDAVPADFVAGVVEMLSPAADPAHWDLIEGQGSLFHPSYAGVSLGLLHGAQADAVVVCHDPRRRHLVGMPDFATPSVGQCIALNLQLGALTRPGIVCAGVSLNTAGMNDSERQSAFDSVARETGLPVCDPAVTGVGRVVDRLLSLP